MFHKLVKFKPWSYQLVQFRDGRFGARKGLFTHSYLELTIPYAEFQVDSNIRRYCKGTKEQALQAILSHKEYQAKRSTKSKFI